MFTQTQTLVGRIGKDPKFGKPDGGKAWLFFSVAVTPRVKVETGGFADGTTTWFDVKAFGTLAQNAPAALNAIKAAKGKVIVVGTFRNEERDFNGTKTSKLVLIADLIGADVSWGLPGSATAAHTMGDNDIEAEMNAEAMALAGTAAPAAATTSRFEDDDASEA